MKTFDPIVYDRSGLSLAWISTHIHVTVTVTVTNNIKKVLSIDCLKLSFYNSSGPGTEYLSIDITVIGDQ
jgi:hypothetical protein